MAVYTITDQASLDALLTDVSNSFFELDISDSSFIGTESTPLVFDATDFSGSILNKVKFQYCNFTNACAFSGITMTSGLIANCNLDVTSDGLSYSNIRHTKIAKNTFSLVNFQHTTLYRCLIIENEFLGGAPVWNNASINLCTLKNDCTSGLFENVSFAGTSWTFSNLTNGSFVNTDFTGANFSHVNFNSSNFENAILNYGRFKNSSFNSSLFNTITAIRTQFNHSNFVNLTLVGNCTLNNANFQSVVWAI